MGVSGGTGAWGGEASAGLGTGGGGASAGVGWGIGGGASITVTGEIASFGSGD